MKIRFLLVISAILFSFPAWAQEKTLLRNIRWGASVPAPGMGTGRPVHLLSFEGAAYEETEFLLPYYTELVPWDDAAGIPELRLSAMRFEPFTEEETRFVKLPDPFPANPDITGKILYLRREPLLEIRLIPFRRNPLDGKPEKLVSFRLDIPAGSLKKQTLMQKGALSYASRSVLASGTWYRMKVTTDGIYRITYEQLAGMGFADPSRVRIFGRGGAMLPFENNLPKQDDLEENAVWFEKGADGIFNQGDYLLFYGKGPGTWVYDSLNAEFVHRPHLYSGASWYFITDAAGTGKQVEPLVSSALPPTVTVNSFHDYAVHEKDLVNLIKSGREWFEPMVPYAPRKLEFSFPNLVTSIPVKVTARLVARAPVSTSFSVALNGTALFNASAGAVNMGSYVSEYAKPAEGSGSGTSSSDALTVTLTYNNQGIPSAECWIDYVRLNARRALTMTGNQMHFRRVPQTAPGETARFVLAGSSEDVRIWEITDPLNARQVQTNREGNNQVFTLETEGIREFIAFRPQGLPAPEIENTAVPNQDLHGLGHHDMVIVSHPDFLAQADQLANHRRMNDGLRVAVVTPEQIYNEFSSGMPDVSAIRNFMKMLYDRAVLPQDMPKYLLLFGDGSYDNLSMALNNTNFILTYQSENSLHPTRSFVTDDFFGLLDDDEGNADGLVDLGIGRLPVSTIQEAQAVTAKIIGYDLPSPQGDWKNTICFIGDDEDYNIHMRDADILANFIDTVYPVFNISKIYLDAYQQVSTPNGQRYPDVNLAISRQVEKGALIINYIGHGNERGLAHEAILGKSDIESWKNAGRLPVFITATCEFSRFDDIERTVAGEFSRKTSAGELVLLNPSGGGVALLTTTRLVYSSPNFVLNRNFYNYVFESDANGNPYRMGDALRLTKNVSGSSLNKRNFTLLGDPSMSIALPPLQVITERINGQEVSVLTDTLKALMKVNVEGFVADPQGNLLSSYEGLLFPAIYDKERVQQTLNNDGQGAMSFKIRNNILYKGKASIQSGRFSFSFIVPKDIAYQVGYGKISYYASGNGEEAAGTFNRILVGGFSSVDIPDTEGPEIRLFMNNEQFVTGGITDENPVLLAFVSDSSGINTVGNGIGHDITATLEGKTRTDLVLNDYYQSDTDSYQSGKIEYPFSGLDPGPYNLKLKIWDVFNNSGSGEIGFIVEKSARLALEHVLNYPNPFTTRTSFFFEHNQPGSPMDVLIQVFTISGRLVKTLHTSIFPDGYRVGPLEWDGLDDYGNTIGRGVYVYRVRVRTSGGQTAEKFEKLVILR